MFRLAPVTETFFDAAPVRYAATWNISRSAEEVWADLNANPPLSWVRGLEVRWTSPAPFGVNSTHVATALGLLRAHEQYFAWEDGTRKSFFVTQSNLPMFKRLAEDYRVVATGPRSCELAWVIAGEPTFLGRMNLPVLNVLMRRFFKDTSDHYGTRAVDGVSTNLPAASEPSIGFADTQER